jgi:DNA-binding NarL/FixJ family response regulator
MGRLGVLIVVDEDDMRALLRNLIEIANDGLSVAGEAADGEEAVRQWREQRPEVVLLDQRMPGLSGLDTAEIILREDPAQAVILFTAYLDDALESTAERVGVKRCVSKEDARHLVNRLRDCAAA